MNEGLKSKTLHQKLLAIRKDCKYLQKEKDGAQYKYVGSSQVLTALRNGMDTEGVLLIPRITNKSVEVKRDIKKEDKYFQVKEQHTFFTEICIDYTWVNVDNPEDTITCPWYAQGVDIAGEKGVGKALTYGEKYFLLKFFNIATDKDDPDAYQGNNDKNRINDSQALELVTAIGARRIDTKKVLEWAQGLSGHTYNETTDIRPEDFAKIMINVKSKSTVDDKLPF